MSLALSISFPSFNPYVYARFSPAKIIQTQEQVTHNIKRRLPNTVPTFSKSSASRIPASISRFLCDDLRWFELTFSSFVICVALPAASSPTFLRNRSTETSSSVDRSPIGSTARAARRWFVLQTFMNFQKSSIYFYCTGQKSRLSCQRRTMSVMIILSCSSHSSGASVFTVFFYAANSSLPSYSGGRRPMMMGIERDLTTTSTRSQPIGKQLVGSSILHAQLSHHTVALELICDIAL